MSFKVWHLLVLTTLLFAQPLVAQSQGAVTLRVPVPDGTKVSPVKYGDSETAVDLKPAEQVAFLFVNGIWMEEQKCLDFGVGRLVTLGELIKGVKAPSGEILGLKVTPARDTNYTYDMILIGEDCIIRAIPRVKGIGAMAIVGTPKRMGKNFYYNPEGADLARAQTVTEMGYSGDGFMR